MTTAGGYSITIETWDMVSRVVDPAVSLAVSFAVYVPRIVKNPAGRIATIPESRTSANVLVIRIFALS